MILSPPPASLIQYNFCLFPTEIGFLLYRADKFLSFNVMYHRFLCEFFRTLLRKVWDPRRSKNRAAVRGLFMIPAHHCTHLDPGTVLGYLCMWQEGTATSASVSTGWTPRRAEVQGKINWWRIHWAQLLWSFYKSESQKIGEKAASCKPTWQGTFMYQGQINERETCFLIFFPQLSLLLEKLT